MLTRDGEMFWYKLKNWMQGSPKVEQTFIRAVNWWHTVNLDYALFSGMMTWCLILQSFRVDVCGACFLILCFSQGLLYFRSDTPFVYAMDFSCFFSNGGVYRASYKLVVVNITLGAGRRTDLELYYYLKQFKTTVCWLTYCG